MLARRRRGKRFLCLGQLGALHPCTTWSTLHLRASHMAHLHRSIGDTVHRSRWPMSSNLPMAGCSTLSPATGWGRAPVLQLWPDWALLS
jgi:hypothetical protein